MAEIWIPKGREIWQYWIDTIIDEASDNLTAWDLNFVSNMETYLTNGRPLTQRQEEILERIYAEKTK
jgi:hypothetical protein